MKLNKLVNLDEKNPEFAHLMNVPQYNPPGCTYPCTNILTGGKQIIGLWTNARYQGRTAGRNMAGADDTFKGNIPHNITHFMDMVFTGLGDLHSGDRHETLQTKDSYVHLVWDKEKLVGVNMLGSSCSNIGIIKNALEKKLLSDSSLDSTCLCSNNLRDNLLINYFKKNK